MPPHERFCLRSSGHPVLHIQARHLAKFAGVVGDQRRLLAEGVGGDHGVERTNRGAAALKVSPEIAIGPEGRFIKRKDRQGGKKHLQRLAVAGLQLETSCYSSKMIASKKPMLKPWLSNLQIDQVPAKPARMTESRAISQSAYIILSTSNAGFSIFVSSANHNLQSHHILLAIK